jgi:hypothetical protein
MMYIVSGFMRSGTSMLMDALSAGGREKGLKCEWSRERDIQMNAANADEDFQPNSSYREIPLEEYGKMNFPLNYDECLIKVMSWGLQQMRRTNGFRCVFMLRDPYEIAESHSRSFGKDLTVMEDGMKLPASESKSWGQQYEQQMKQAIINAETRNDCASLHVFNYSDVLKDPHTHFQLLSDCGWPIDHLVASSLVQPNKKRV